MEDDIKCILQDKEFHLQLKSELKEIIQNVLERKDKIQWQCYPPASERTCVAFSPSLILDKVWSYMQIISWYIHSFRVRNCQSCQIWPEKFGQILISTDTRLVFCNRKLMRTDIVLTRTTKPICNFANSVHCGNRSFLEVTCQMFENESQMTKW